jgi:hypothetical protein
MCMAGLLFSPAAVAERSRSVAYQASSLCFVDSVLASCIPLLETTVPRPEVVSLDAEDDGVAYITEILARRPCVQSVRIVARGGPGCLYLGNSELNLHTLEQYGQLFIQWFQGLAHDICTGRGSMAIASSMAPVIVIDVPLADDMEQSWLANPQNQALVRSLQHHTGAQVRVACA